MNPAALCRPIVDLLFPPGPCILCGGESRGGPVPGICRSCWRGRSKLRDPRCARCGVPFSCGPRAATPSSLCGACLKALPPFEAHVSIYSYEGPVRRLILLYKDEGRYPFARPLGRALARRVRAEWPKVRFDGVVPVPGAGSRRLRRGYNPSDLIAVHVSRRLGVPRIPALGLRKTILPQKGLSAPERRKNVRGAYRADPVRVRDRTLLVVDDVTTTGSTLREAARTLVRSGATVYCATVAMALRRDMDWEGQGPPPHGHGLITTSSL